MQLGRKKFILRVGNLMPQQSEGNNHMSEINVSIFNSIFAS